MSPLRRKRERPKYHPHVGRKREKPKDRARVGRRGRSGGTQGCALREYTRVEAPMELGVLEAWRVVTRTQPDRKLGVGEW